MRVLVLGKQLLVAVFKNDTNTSYTNTLGTNTLLYWYVQMVNIDC